MEYIAHIRKDGSIQSVKSHCKATAEIGKDFGKITGTENIARLQGILHDIGKMTETFSKYIKGETNLRRGEIDHSYAGARYICELADKMNDKKYDKCARFIARTIISHHGLHDWVKNDGSDYFSKRVSERQGYDEILKAVSEAFNEDYLISLLEKSNDEYTKIRKRLYDICIENIAGCENRKTAFAFYLGMFERYMQSVLIDADRIDTADFMFDSTSDASLNENELDLLWLEMKKRLDNMLEDFSALNDKISMQRKSISQRCSDFARHHCGICRLIVPTGGGKTLSSMRYAIEYAKKFQMKKIIYIAPFMSILEQNGDEIRSLAGEENFLEHHSNILAEIEDEDELHEYELRTEKWDKPVIATTMVQFLNVLFSGKNSAIRRMHRLSKAVIIIDEVQSLPLRCSNMFNLAMNFLTNICDDTVVLCSATQPVFDEMNFPIMIDSESSMTGDFKVDFETFKRTDIKMRIEKYGYTYQSAAEFCYEKFVMNENLLVIVNTKAAALNIYNHLKNVCCDNTVKIIHLSTNMCPQHRRDKIKEIKQFLSLRKPLICVTTQLIEAGVDISFNCVVRSLAGMDSIAQAAGRCNRNGEVDKLCPVYVINISDENLSRLTDIKDAAAVSRQMADSGQIDDYLSVDTMSVYYRKLFKEKSRELSYNIKDNDLDTSLLELLSLDKGRIIDMKRTDSYSAQAFKTAGRLFNAIESNTVDIIVPYNDEAKQILLKLNSDISSNETIKLLRKAQKYTVGIYSGINDNLLKKGALHLLDCGATELKREFHSSEFGVTTEEQLKEKYIY